jgi:hypothetical protein
MQVCMSGVIGRIESSRQELHHRSHRDREQTLITYHVE